MVTSGYIPNIHHPEAMRSILVGIVDNRLIDELAAFGADLEDREPDEADRR